MQVLQVLQLPFRLPPGQLSEFTANLGSGLRGNVRDWEVDSRASMLAQALWQRAAEEAKGPRGRETAEWYRTEGGASLYEASGIGNKEFKIKRFVD